MLEQDEALRGSGDEMILKRTHASVESLMESNKER